MGIKVKVKADGNDAKKVVEAIHAGLPSKTEVRAERIPNYVSNDSCFIPAGANSDKQKGNERLPASTQAPRAGEARQSCSEAEYKARAFPAASVNSVDDASAATRVKPTTVGGAYDKLPPNHPEHDRQYNNRSRDMRTNLGRGKRGTFVD